MLIKIYTLIQPPTPSLSIQEPHEELHIIESAQDVIIHQGNWTANLWTPTPHPNPWGPSPTDLPVETYGAEPGDSVRIIDYTTNNQRKRALIKLLAYVCNDSGKTIERVEMYSGARMSKTG